jgi:hypothetical protein
MRNDFEKLQNGARIKLIPNGNNPLHSQPVKCVYSDGFFYCDGSPYEEGPDYYIGDVLRYNDGYDFIETEEDL